MGGEHRVTGEILRDSNGFSVSYRFVGMMMTVPHRHLASLFMLGLINAAFD